jgi:hypothetical protein
MTIGEEFLLEGQRVRVTDERLITSYTGGVYDPDGKLIRQSLPLAYTAVFVEPVPPPEIESGTEP